MNRFLTKLFIIMLFFWLPAAFAAKVTDLYAGTVPVANQSKAALRATLPKALAQVLVKVSGNPNVTDDDAVAQGLTQAPNMLSSYSYVEQTDTQDQQLLLQAQFEPSAVIKLLQNAGQPVWGENRPLVLIWLAVKDSDGLVLLTTDSQNPLTAGLEMAAKLRGLPIVIPIGDMIDLNVLRAKDVADFDIDKIESASNRYQADTILIGTIEQQTDNRWQTRWQLLGPVTGEDEATADTPSQAVDIGINWLTDQLSQRYAVQVNVDKPTVITAHIDNIGGLDDYAEVVKYLSSLTPVQKVETEDLSSGHVVLKLQVLGGEEALLRAISAEKKLTESQATIPPAEGQPEILYLQWQ